jgi:predicted CXXCH cytochrome family protein
MLTRKALLSIGPIARIGVAAGSCVLATGMIVGLAAITKTRAQSDGAAKEVSVYVGAQACAACHQSEFAAWRRSHHALAMQPPTADTVLGRFDGATFQKDGVTTTFFKRDGKFWVRTDGADGKLADFEVRYTFGVSPLQQYLLALPGGRLQAFGIAWDARAASKGGHKWYHLYPDQKLTAGNPLHWTGIDQNWNYQCAWCHSTNLKKNYDAKSNTFNTRWSEINVACEACHGPGSRHVAWASAPKPKAGPAAVSKGLRLRFDKSANGLWQFGSSNTAHRTQRRDTAKEIRVCARCHARRGQFSDNVDEVESLYDAFRPALLAPGLYHVDGQQRDEVYKYGSFLQSRMHANGVTCSDCHNAHSGQLKFDGNTLCAQCHAPASFDTSKHHHHVKGSAGSECVSCHMPATTYMGVDRRRDHSIRIPRPDRTVTLGVPNACNSCHKDKKAQWAAAAVKRWFPVQNSGAQSFAEAFALADRGAPGARKALLDVVSDTSLAGLVRASAIARLQRLLSPSVLSVVVGALKDNDPLVRSAAVDLIATVDLRLRQSLLIPVLADPVRLVRMDAARALAGIDYATITADDQTRLKSALDEYIAAQKFNAERPESHANLAALYRDKSMPDKARAAFEEALRIDPSFAPAAIGLAEILRRQGDEGQAEATLRQALTKQPDAAALQLALGLSLVRQKRTSEAIEWFAKAARGGQEEAHFSYVYAVALRETGQQELAITVLRRALTHHPYDRQILMGLVSYELAGRDLASALKHAELLAELEPENPRIARLVRQLRQRLQ